MTAQLIEDYATWLRSWGAAKRTVQARTSFATARLRDWGVDGFTQANITVFMSNDGWKDWTRSTYHTHLTDLCAWLYLAGHIEDNPMPGVRKPRRGSEDPRPLSEREVERVLSVVQGQTRDWILLALNVGLRASEIAKIRGEDVTADGVHVLGKGGKIVTLPCHPDVWDMAQRYPQYDYWFPGADDGHIHSQQISLTVGRLFHPMGIKGSIHRCRHVYGTRLMRAPGVNVRTVQKLMRHSNLDTTAHYAAVDEDEMRAAINCLPSVSAPAAPAA